VITATNKDLDTMVKEGGFRQDLFFRINVITLKLPPLRERREDIPLLVEHFIARFNRLFDREITGLSPRVLQVLLSYDFPGNIRELENIIERAFILCRGNIISSGDLPEYLRPAGDDLPEEETGSLKEMEARVIKEALIRNNGSRRKTAGELGIHPSTLWRKMKRLGINVPGH